MANYFGVRHIQASFLFFGICFGYFLRVNISAAIVPMTQPNSEYISYEYWDSRTKSLILSSFFWGYVLAQVPASILARRFGGKVVLGGATAAGALITTFHPVAVVKGDWKLLCFLRVLVGLTQGVVYPCLHTLLAKWVPHTERGFLSAFVYSGAQFGTAILLVISGSIFNSNMRWPGIFYISGGIALLWSIIFLIFGSDSPRNSNNISKHERNYIEALTGADDQQSQDMVVPWKSIFTSIPFFALIAAHCGFTWGFYTLLTEVPTYLSSVLNLDIKSNALLSALPYFVMWILCLTLSPIADLLINHRIISVTVSRKLFNSIGQWTPMACLIALGYINQNAITLSIVLLTIGIGFNAASFCGYLVNHMDLSPNFAGTLMGVTNGISNLLSIFAPLVAGSIIQNNEEDPEEWRKVFLITATFYFLCNLIFVVFGKATVQPWDTKLTCVTSVSTNSMPTSISAIASENSLTTLTD
uniref:Putative inorganic phosphate cotransporter n=1 Tax=Glossina brevipalpis TaxID=37001 RepID=A0A1A9WGM3_9MUSC